MKKRKAVSAGAVLATMLAMAGCGGGGGTPTAVPTPTPVPGVAIAAIGDGSIVIHLSRDSRFGFALETPIKITEAGGGSASWDFVRYQIFRSGREVERYELGSSDISNAGYHLIAASSSKTYTVVYRQNSDDFDRIDITLGFTDQKDARSFTVAVPFNSFRDVVVSPTPLAVPPGGTIRLGGGDAK